MNNFLIALGLINFNCTLAVINMVRPRDPEPPPSIVHAVAFLEDDKITSGLDARAAAGWELVTCRRACSGGLEYGSCGLECAFRRAAKAVDR